MKRNLGVGGDKNFKQQSKLNRMFSRAFSSRALQELVPSLEPVFRTWVREEVDSSLNRILRHPQDQLQASGSRNLQLKFEKNLPHTLYTGNKVVSDDKGPLQIFLYDTISQKIVTSGHLSAIKVSVVVLDGNFGPDDGEDWTRMDFNHNVVQNREGKKPLVTGDLKVTLQQGEGYIGEFIFTDNSSWTRSGKFRLGAKVHSSVDVNIKEGISNSFKVKDHRGESYQKHHPPSLDDEVWRLEKIAKEGTSHKRLNQRGIFNVGDFLRAYVIDKSSLRNMLPSTSAKAWEKIIGHALTCTLDDRKYMYKSAEGTLFFDSISNVIGVTFDGQGFCLVDNLNLYQKGALEKLKQDAYKNANDWVLVSDPSFVGWPMLLTNPAIENVSSSTLVLPDNNSHVQDQLVIQMNNDHPSISPPFNSEVEQETSSFEMGESSHKPFNANFRDSFGMIASPCGLFFGDHNWASGSNYMGSQLTSDDIPVGNNFQVVGQGNSFCHGSINHGIGMFSTNSGNIIPRNTRPRTKWCKVLAPVKWMILVKRNIAARETNNRYNYI